jgi:DNA recombination protein RmuC
VLDKVKKQLATASNTIDETQTRTRAMARKLREVEQLPAGESDELLELLPEEDFEDN